VTITQPPAITLTPSSVQATCGQSNGSASVTASGGTPSYSYSWNTTPVQTTQNASGLPSGNYTVTVTDANGCTATASAIVGNANGPTAAIATQTNVLCNGGNNGSATVNVTGGSPSYTYAWSSGGNAATENNLAAGNYTVTVTDANGCTTTAVVTITQPPAITLTPSSVQTTCGQSNGSASVTASGGTPSYSYSWNTTPDSDNTKCFRTSIRKLHSHRYRCKRMYSNSFCYCWQCKRADSNYRHTNKCFM
jgi:hypothetical protein